MLFRSIFCPDPVDEQNYITIHIKSITFSTSMEPGVTPPTESAKPETPPTGSAKPETPPTGSAKPETPSQGDKPEESENPAQQPVTLDLSKPSTYTVDGAGVKPAYDAANGCLAVVLPQFQGIILKVPDDGKTYKNMKLTYTSDSKMNVYLFDGAMTDGIGQTTGGQHEVIGRLRSGCAGEDGGIQSSCRI